METVIIRGQWSPDANPALLAALQEMALLAYKQVSKPILPAVDEPHKQPEGPEQHSADNAADNQ